MKYLILIRKLQKHSRECLNKTKARVKTEGFTEQNKRDESFFTGRLSALVDVMNILFKREERQ